MSKNTKTLIDISVAGWGLLALFYGFGVAVTFERGSGQVSSLVVPGIPLVALALSVGVPMHLSHVGWMRSAFAIAMFVVVALVPVYLFTLALWPV